MRLTSLVSFKISHTAVVRASLLTLVVSCGLTITACSVAQADPSAVNVPDALRSDPQVAQMISEYNAISASNPICNDKKLFGLRTIKVDGLPRVRYYVDGKGVSCIPSRLQPNEAWRISRLDWTAQDDLNWSNFISTLGMAIEQGKCTTVDSCLISQANVLKQPNDDLAFHYSDCADFPFVLRAYFSFRSQLPFSYASRTRPRALTPDDAASNSRIQGELDQLTAKQQSGAQLSIPETQRLAQLTKVQSLRDDPRYTPNGNWVSARNGVMEDGQVNYYGFVRLLRDAVSTATYRVWRNQGETGVSLGENLTETEPDFYSPRLDRTGIVPGTVIYKTDGHAGIVYRVDQLTGLIYYMDSHPDNSISHGVIDETWTNEFATRPNYGGGFKNFRPTVYEKAWWFGQTTARLKTDEELGPMFSSEQYDRFSVPGAKVTMSIGKVQGVVGYNDFLRLRLSNGTYRIDPLLQFRADAKALCTNIQSRRDDVGVATEKDIHLLAHPDQLPDNIFGASGDWETYSTPGRDVTFKSRVINLGTSLRKYRDMINAKHFLMKPGMTVDLLKSQAKQAWADASAACKVSYVNSRGAEVSFSLSEAVARSPLMSFDPFTCPEHRFGASAPAELATCTDTAVKADWYSFEQFLRNRTVKNNLEPMGWSLEQLRAIPNASTVDPTIVQKLDVLTAIDAL